MTANTYVSRSIDVQLNIDALTECPSVSTFAPHLPAPETRIGVDGVYVSLHRRDDSAVIVVDYPGEEDTAFSGDIMDAHKAVCRLARHTDADVHRDEFDILTEDDSRTSAGEGR